MHLNFLHMIFNLVAVTPLIERFESEYGTLVALALFTGRKCLFGLYGGGLGLMRRKRSERSQEVSTHY